MENKIWRITIDSNPEDCNLNCIMCEEHSQYSSFKKDLFEKTGIKHRRMSGDIIVKIINEAKMLGVKEIIPTTMGDPLVSDSIFTIIEQCKEKDIKLNVTHNGTFPGKSGREWAELLVPTTSDIKISWNAATKSTAEMIMKGLDFDKAVSELKEFVAYRDYWYQTTGYYCSVSLQLTFMRNNMHEIAEIIDLAHEIGIDRIKGHHLWVHFPEIEDLSYNKNDQTRKEWNEIASSANKYAAKKNATSIKILKLENFIPFDEKQQLEIPGTYECPFLGRELWVSATGNISPCCAPDNLRQSLGEFGNINLNSLAEIVNANNYQNLLTTYKSKELCKTCTMRKPL
jgi:radical SAM protein with 4Fe4S-binding SPASM domain